MFIDNGNGNGYFFSVLQFMFSEFAKVFFSFPLIDSMENIEQFLELKS